MAVPAISRRGLELQSLDMCITLHLFIGKAVDVFIEKEENQQLVIR